MTDLLCSVKNCSYNADHMCCKGNIRVDGKGARNSCDTKCASFVNCNNPENCGCHNSTMSPEKKIEVKCEAVNCVYNDNKVCKATHVGVVGHSADSTEQTECATFRCR